MSSCTKILVKIILPEGCARSLLLLTGVSEISYCFDYAVTVHTYIVYSMAFRFLFSLFVLRLMWAV